MRLPPRRPGRGLSARWPTLLLTALLAPVLTAGYSGEGPGSMAASGHDQPSVLLIVTDDMRYDDLEHMPNVQALLVEQGTTFSRFYSTFPLCCPARASMLTGQYAHNHGVLSNHAPYGGFEEFRDESTLATWLTPTHTVGLVGKYLNEYGVGNDPLYVPPGWDFWRGSPLRTYDYFNIGLTVDGSTVDSFKGVNSTRVIADESLGFLAAHGQEPFFLFSSFIAPHFGWPRERDDPVGRETPFVGSKYRDTYQGPPLPEDPSFNEADISDKRPSVQNKLLLSEAQITKLEESIAQRRESLRLVDDQVARLVADLPENTYVIFVSDNGFLQGEHRIFGGKGLPYNPASHVPLVIRGPGVPAGQTVDGMAGMHDLAPTILELTQTGDTQASHSFDGQSLVPMLTESSYGDERTLVLEAGDNNGGYAFYGIIRGDGWKYVEFTTDGINEVEMYDLQADPYEERNLAEDPAYAAKRAELAAETQLLRFCAGSQCG